jgi:hypothetical protein
VVAARSYWNADHAAVVSNAGFTRAARKLAAATDVLLLHHAAGVQADLGTRRSRSLTSPRRPVPAGVAPISAAGSRLLLHHDALPDIET